MAKVTATKIAEAQEAMMSAAHKLAERTDLQNDLMVFVNHWGLESYTAPQDVRDAVRNLVHGMVAASRCLNPE